MALRMTRKTDGVVRGHGETGSALFHRLSSQVAARFPTLAGAQVRVEAARGSPPWMRRLESGGTS